MAPPLEHIPTPGEELRALVRMRKRGMYVYALPNFFTSMNLVLGYLAILAAVEGRFERGAWAILLASVFDTLDGRVARLTNTTSRFGVEYDSLCDLVSFGVAPSLLVYFAALKPFGRVGIVVALVFSLCGALRLARFNVMAEVLPKSYFQGLPIPMAAGTICTGIFFAKEFSVDIMHNPAVLILTAAIGLLMVSTFRFPSFKDIHFRHRRPFTPIAFSIAAIFALISWFETTAFLLLLSYIVISLGFDLARTWKARWKRNAA
ncbi:MAG: CDP-diacylglycerol--serine O-phosphatidyltransferase [Bdellovibrionota bacterium]